MTAQNQILTKEERDILILVAVHPGLKHLTNEEIGQRLEIPVSKVKTLMYQACQKLNADNRNEAVFLAMKQGEIKLDELLSLEELAEILGSMDPDVLRMIASCVRSKQTMLLEYDEKYACIERKPDGILTNRERDVLILASSGISNFEIATQLCMTTSAVRTFLNRAFKKLGARKKPDAVQLALKLREISVGEISTLKELANFLAPLGADSIDKVAELLERKRENELTNSGGRNT
jgi:DNA-binding CsgD family transcriptional regulator